MPHGKAVFLSAGHCAGRPSSALMPAMIRSITNCRHTSTSIRQCGSPQHATKGEAWYVHIEEQSTGARHQPQFFQTTRRPTTRPTSGCRVCRTAPARRDTPLPTSHRIQSVKGSGVYPGGDGKSHQMAQIYRTSIISYSHTTRRPVLRQRRRRRCRSGHDAIGE